MSTVLVYDLETIPDIQSGRKLLDLKEASDLEVVDALIERRQQQTQGTSSFLPHYLQKIVAISLVLQTNDQIKVWSLGDNSSSEKDLIERFFAGLDRYTPTLVSWNGCQFDLPVLHYRALLHGVPSTKYWETGDCDNSFRWNNYISRYHQRHTDLMDVLAGYNNRAFAPLNEIAQMLGLPGKMGMAGDQVFTRWQQGDLQSIRDYCETDVLNTYLVYLKFQYIRGFLDDTGLKTFCSRLKESLATLNKPHLNEFLAECQWQEFLQENSCHPTLSP